MTVVWPTGFTVLPYQGGLDEQPYLTTVLYAAFLRGEQHGVARTMAKS